MSIRGVSVVNMREAGCEKGLPRRFYSGYFQQLRHCGRFAGCGGQRGALVGVERDGKLGSGVLRPAEGAERPWPALGAELEWVGPSGRGSFE